MLRTVACLLLFAACVTPGRGDQADSKADFTETIPAGGTASTTQKVFWLKPGQVLAIVDNSKKAVFDPVPAGHVANSSEHADLFDPKSPGSLNAIAYAFKEGACDFNTTVEYKEVFRKLDTYKIALWTPGKISSSELSQDAAVKNYTFTNPPAEFLDGVVSFCVRFKTAGARAQSLRSAQEEAHAANPTYLEVVIHSSAAGFTAKILSILGLTAAAVAKALGC